MSEFLNTNEVIIGPNPRVMALDYLGGEGGYCEPLIIETNDKSQYVLHQAYLSSAGRRPGDYVLRHRVINYETQEDLVTAFTEIKKFLSIPRTIDGWVDTDATLGFYDISANEFRDATNRIFKIPYDQRPLANA